MNVRYDFHHLATGGVLVAAAGLSVLMVSVLLTVDRAGAQDDGESADLEQQVVDWLKRTDKDGSHGKAPWEHGEAVLPILEDILENPDSVHTDGPSESYVLQRALVILNELGPKASSLEDRAASYLVHSDEDVSRRALIALGGIGSTEFTDAITTHLYADSASLWVPALQALKKVGRRRALLVALEKWRDFADARYADNQSKREWSNDYLQKHYRPTREAIQERADGEDGEIYEALSSDSTERIVEAMESVPERDDAGRYTAALVAFLYDDQAKRRNAALETLRQIGDRDTAIALRIWHRQTESRDEQREDARLDDSTRQTYEKTLKTIERRSRESTE